VQIARELQATYANNVQVEIFTNRQRAKARKLILDWWNRKGDNKFTTEKTRNTPVILFGHSWGASTVISLAGELQVDGMTKIATRVEN
jgi:predicted dienelactone hydrolase